MFFFSNFSVFCGWEFWKYPVPKIMKRGSVPSKHLDSRTKSASRRHSAGSRDGAHGCFALQKLP